MRANIFLFHLLIIFSCICFSQNSGDINIEWRQTIHQDGFNSLTSIKQTPDNGFILCGYSTILYNGDKNSSLIVKLRSDGSIIWSKLLTDSINNYARHIIVSSDSNYVIVGMTNKHGQNSTLRGDFWIIKLDAGGNEIWKKTYGGSQPEEATSIIENKNGDLIIAGYTSSNDGDVSGFHGKPWISADFWLIALNKNGDLLWQKCYGGNSWDEPQKIIQTNDNNYLLVGRSASTDGDIINNIGNFDICVFKVDTNGDILWNKNFGSLDRDYGFDIKENADSTIIVTGISEMIQNNNSQMQSVIYTLDHNGNLLSEIKPAEIKPVCILKNNGFLGYNKLQENSDRGTCILKTDAAMQIEWEYCLEDFKEGNIAEILELEDKSFVMGAMNYIENDGEYYIVKWQEIK